jgi:hypothetical protein
MCAGGAVLGASLPTDSEFAREQSNHKSFVYRKSANPLARLGAPSELFGGLYRVIIGNPNVGSCNLVAVPLIKSAQCGQADFQRRRRIWPSESHAARANVRGSPGE